MPIRHHLRGYDKWTPTVAMVGWKFTIYVVMLTVLGIGFIVLLLVH